MGLECQVRHNDQSLTREAAAPGAAARFGGLVGFTLRLDTNVDDLAQRDRQ